MTTKRLDKNPTHKQAPRYDRVLISPNLGGGGAQRVVTVLANAWSRRGERVCIITLFGGEAHYAIDEAIVHIDLQRTYLAPQPVAAGHPASVGTPEQRASLPNLGQRLRRKLWRTITLLPWTQDADKYYYAARMALRLRHVLQQLDAPAVIAFTGGTNIITVVASIGQQRRVVISERNDPARQRLEIPWQSLRPYVYPWADVVTANTHNALDIMARYVARAKLVYLPNPLLMEERARIGKDNCSVASPITPTLPTNAQPTILTVGRLHQQKAQDVLLMAFQRLPQRLLSWQIMVVGDGDEGRGAVLGFLMVGDGDLRSELEALALTLAINQRVHWQGWVANPHPYYQSAQIFVLPSRHEGMSNALLEAMMYGLPVIVTDACQGLLEIIVHGDNGLVVPVDDPDALAAAITQLADDPALCQRLGAAARNRVSAFTLPQILQQWDAVLAG